MAGLDKAMEAAAERAEAHRGVLVDAAVTDYFRNLSQDEFPRQDALVAAEQNALRRLLAGIWQSEWVRGVLGESAESEDRVEALRLTFVSLAPPLRVPVPTGVMELHPRSLGYAAAVGAVLGLLLMLAISRLLGGQVKHLDIGIIISAPLGAFAMVALASWISKRRRLLRMLQGVLGLATAAEVWLAVAGVANPLAGLWRRLRGRHPRWGLLRRLITYVAVMLLLQLMVRRPTFYRDDHEVTVRQAVEQWLDGAVRLQAAICHHAAESGGTAATADLAALARHLYAIRQSTREELPIAAAELIQEARNVGFEGLEGEPSFLGHTQEPATVRWTKDLAERYETFGHVEEGDAVTVEREAVVRDGQVLSRGLVRRVRGGNA